MTTQEYEQNERRIFLRDIARIETASLGDRRAARGEFLADMRKHPEIVAERIGWLLAGNYGAGAQMAAQEVLASRMNKQAWLVQTIACLDWQCPRRLAADAWKALSDAEKRALQREVERVMETRE